MLKREKLDYTFQSLSVISILPMLFLEPLKNWVINEFGMPAIEQFYNGKIGMVIQILVLLTTFVSYVLIRKLKDNGSTNNIKIDNNENPWQNKVYNIPIIKNIVNLFMPKKGTKSERILKEKLKKAASKQKIEWMYVNKITLFICTFFVSIFMCFQIHRIAVNYVYTSPTTDYDLLGQMTEKEAKKANELTELDNKFIDKFKKDKDITVEQIQAALSKSEEYKDQDASKISIASQRIYDKMQIINSEYFQWYEILISFVMAILAYMVPSGLLLFQIKMRELEMENEVMQFQTIILMLMKIERVDVQTILEWIERYSNIFKEPISKCLNNYESGAYEALEELKREVSYKELIRLIEGLQSSVESLPVVEAFDELETEREYYKEKRKLANDRLITTKGIIGKAIGFTPMVMLFVGYLIIPLIYVGIKSLSSSMTSISNV